VQKPSALPAASNPFELIMTRAAFTPRFLDAFARGIVLNDNFAVSARASTDVKQQQTNSVFSEKWNKYDRSDEKNKLFAFQRNWYLTLYGFASEQALGSHLRRSRVILDAGCGLGYKAAWFAELAPESLVIGMDFSDAAAHAASNYAGIDNLFFVQGDIADTGLGTASVDYVSCDQVIMHTESPERTFTELARITSITGQLACYFYAKKALPRELLDDYFRSRCSHIEREKLWAMSEQLAELGRRLSLLKVEIDVPEIPELGIKGGTYDIQRFIYWNFLKCFWNAELGVETSVVTNFDWYSPSNARRFSESAVRAIVAANSMREVFFHSEEACYSGRFAHDE
jgi:ubiquinone/menaquinone biosynthesis C-methylase UbiE